MLQRFLQRFWRGDLFLHRFGDGGRLPAVSLFFRRGFLLECGRCRTRLNALRYRGQSFKRGVVHRPRSSWRCRFTLFWFGYSLRTLQLAACGKHRTGGIRQRHVLRRRCRLRRHLLRRHHRGRGDRREGLSRHFRLGQRHARVERQRAQQRHFNAHPAVRRERQLFAAN